MTKISELVDAAIVAIVVTAFAVMFALLFGNVVLRFVFSSGLAVAEEIARFAFVWATFLGAVLALKRNGHIGIAGVRGRIPATMRSYFDGLVLAIEIAVSMIVLIGAIAIFDANIGGRAPVSKAPITIAIASVVAGAALMLAVFGTRLLALVRRHDGSS